MPQARVFISCGQRPEARETEVAAAVATALANEGFSPYVAVRQQTLQGLKENIFEKIEEAEYFRLYRLLSRTNSRARAA